MKNKDHIFESAYWAGRMIDMPDSKMAWDIANEIASELKQVHNKAIDEAIVKVDDLLLASDPMFGIALYAVKKELESLKH